MDVGGSARPLPFIYATIIHVQRLAGPRFMRRLTWMRFCVSKFLDKPADRLLARSLAKLVDRIDQSQSDGVRYPDAIVADPDAIIPPICVSTFE